MKNNAKISDYFWKCIDKCDIDKYLGKSSSLGGSSNNSVLKQFKSDVKNMKSFFTDIGVSNINFDKLQQRKFKEMQIKSSPLK